MKIRLDSKAFDVVILAIGGSLLVLDFCGKMITLPYKKCSRKIKKYIRQYEKI